jgi:hypothetical protein
VLDIIEYESRFNLIWPKYQDITVCVYDATKFSAEVMMGMVRTHPLVIVDSVARPNPFYVPPEERCVGSTLYSAHRAIAVSNELWERACSIIKTYRLYRFPGLLTACYKRLTSLGQYWYIMAFPTTQRGGGLRMRFSSLPRTTAALRISRKPPCRNSTSNLRFTLRGLSGERKARARPPSPHDLRYT